MIQAIGRVRNGRVIMIAVSNGLLVSAVKPITRPVVRPIPVPVAATYVPVVNTATVTVATVIDALDVPAFMKQRSKELRAHKRMSRLFKAH